MNLSKKNVYTLRIQVMIHHRIAPLMEMTLNNESTHRDNNDSLNSIGSE